MTLIEANALFLKRCASLLSAYKTGKLGKCPMPEDAHPAFLSFEDRLAYFTLPMSLNYQRNSYTLWQSALAAYNDADVRDAFKVTSASEMSFEKLFAAADFDFLKLRDLVQLKHKKGFPYLSGPKIFHYWSFIMSTYGGVGLKNTAHIEIAPDTHIRQCSVKLGLIVESERETIAADELSRRWRAALENSGITPIQMHPPLWFWSRSGFLFDVDEK